MKGPSNQAATITGCAAFAAFALHLAMNELSRRNRFKELMELVQKLDSLTDPEARNQVLIMIHRKQLDQQHSNDLRSGVPQLECSSPAMKGLVRKMSFVDPEFNNPWHFTTNFNNRSGPNRYPSKTNHPKSLRKDILNFYQREVVDDDGDDDNESTTTTSTWNIKGYCLITNTEGGNKHVIVMHLLPKNLPQNVMEYWVAAFGIDSVNDLRNTMPCCKNIENLFDHGKACIVPCDDDIERATFKILYDDAKEEMLFEGSGTKIGDFDGHQFDLCSGGKMPKRQILAFHAEQAHLHAKKKGWIRPDTKIPEGLWRKVSPLKNDLLLCNMATETAAKIDFQSDENSVTTAAWLSNFSKDNACRTPTTSPQSSLSAT